MLEQLKLLVDGLADLALLGVQHAVGQQAQVLAGIAQRRAQHGRGNAPRHAAQRHHGPHARGDGHIGIGQEGLQARLAAAGSGLLVRVEIGQGHHRKALATARTALRVQRNGGHDGAQDAGPRHGIGKQPHQRHQGQALAHRLGRGGQERRQAQRQQAAGQPVGREIAQQGRVRLAAQQPQAAPGGDFRGQRAQGQLEVKHGPAPSGAAAPAR